jgi:hypothetical protein
MQQAQNGVPVDGPPRSRGVHVVSRNGLRGARELRRQPDGGLHPLPCARDVAGEEALLGQRPRHAGLLFLARVRCHCSCRCY